MKIAFVGKGGSGKSTVATLFANYLADQNEHVLAVDADINQHLGMLIGVSEDEMKNIPSLGHEIEAVRKYVTGNNTRIKSPSHLRMTTPPTMESRVIYPNKDDTFLNRYIIKKGNINFATTGEFEFSDVGMICYHGKTMSTEIVFNHLADSKNEYVIVDMTAGADAFSTGIFLKFDLIVLVVEPTAQSLSVFNQFKEYGKDYNINLKVIGNKVENEEDETFIRHYVTSAYIGSIPYTKEIRNLERGLGLSQNLKESVSETMKKLKQDLDKTEKDWGKFYNDLVNLHKKHAESWLNSSFQTNFEDQIDENFDPGTFFKR